MMSDYLGQHTENKNNKKNTCLGTHLLGAYYYVNSNVIRIRYLSRRPRNL